MVQWLTRWLNCESRCCEFDSRP